MKPLHSQAFFEEEFRMFFRTGEFARMLSVEKSVLIYYDRLGLLCPGPVDGNG